MVIHLMQLFEYHQMKAHLKSLPCFVVIIAAVGTAEFFTVRSCNLFKGISAILFPIFFRSITFSDIFPNWTFVLTNLLSMCCLMCRTFHVYRTGDQPY